MFLNKTVEHNISLVEQAAPILERTGDKVSAITHRGIDGVREASHQLRVKAEHAADNTVSYIRQAPVKSVLIAAATGAALMALASLARRARDHS